MPRFGCRRNPGQPGNRGNHGRHRACTCTVQQAAGCRAPRRSFRPGPRERSARVADDADPRRLQSRARGSAHAVGELGAAVDRRVRPDARGARRRGRRRRGRLHADSYRTEPLPPDDAEVYGTIGVNPSDQRSMYLYLNIQDAGTPGFDACEARWFHWVSGDGFYLRKITNGGTPQNFFGSPLQVWDAEEPSAGDMLLLRRVGSQLQFWHRNAGTWVLRLTANDSQFMGGSARTRTSSSATSSREAVSPASWTSQVRSGTSSSAAQARSTTTTTSRPHRVAAEKSCFRSSSAAAQAQQSKRRASRERDVERQRCQITSALVRTRASRFLRTAASRQRTSSEKSTN